MTRSTTAHDTLTVERHLPYGPASVSSAFASAEAKGAWAGEREELDFRPGGLERWTVDGSVHAARFIDIVRDQRIVYVEERSVAGVRIGAALVTITMLNQPGGVQLSWTEQSTMFDQHDLADRRAAIQELLDRLPGYLGRTRVAAEPIRVSRHIAASADRIFEILADPGNHPALDGSGMVRAADHAQPLQAAGDTFTMHMRLQRLGDYLILNKVIDLVPGRRIEWAPTPGDEAASDISGIEIGDDQGYTWAYELEPDGEGTLVTEIWDGRNADEAIRRAVDDGRSWIGSMTETLERLARMLE